MERGPREHICTLKYSRASARFFIRRHELEYIIREVGRSCECREFFLLGGKSILALKVAPRQQRAAEFQRASSAVCP